MPDPVVAVDAPPVVESSQQEKDQLATARDLLVQASTILTGLIEARGCLHEDRQDVTTMGSLRKFYCHDCDEWFEEKDDALEI